MGLTRVSLYLMDQAAEGQAVIDGWFATTDM